jgi:hypothetical protein
VLLLAEVMAWMFRSRGIGGRPELTAKVLTLAAKTIRCSGPYNARRWSAAHEQDQRKAHASQLTSRR